ncbi:unnamed protein product, partial [marine sediment metagenome]
MQLVSNNLVCPQLLFIAHNNFVTSGIQLDNIKA